MTAIAGYAYGEVAPSPVGMEDLDTLLATLLWTEDDASALRLAGEVLEDQIEDVLDLWYGYVGSHHHLVRSFYGSDGAPDVDYLGRVRARFGQWIRDLTTRPWDDAWLAYQEEIALRHAPEKKNMTDGVDSPDSHIPARYLVAFIWPITATVREFLGRKGHGTEEVDAMHQAWFKAVTLSTVLWLRPYCPETW